MGSLLSRQRAAADHHSDADAQCSSHPSCRDSLSAIAAEYWLSVDQLHCLFIAEDSSSLLLSSSLSSPTWATATSPSSASLLTSSPPLSPASAAKCSATRHVPSCCCASSSLPSPTPVSLGPFRPFALDAAPLPPPSPADLAVGLSSTAHAHSSYRPATERDALYCSAIRPLLSSALLASTDLDPDCLALTLDYLIQPPSLSPHQLIGLALLTPQHLHPAQAADAAAAAAFSDLTLSESGCFIHRRGVVDRARSLQAHEMRLNFATVQKGLWKVSDEGQQQLQLERYVQEDFYFEQRLFKDKAHRCTSMRIEPYGEEVAKECVRGHPLCLVNDLLVVCGQETI